MMKMKTMTTMMKKGQELPEIGKTTVGGDDGQDDEDYGQPDKNQ